LGAEFRQGDGHVRTEARLRAAEGTDRWFELIVRPRRDVDGTHLGSQGTLRDVTERTRLEALLAEQALNDPLTGLPNRRSFDDVVQRLLLQAKRTGELVAVGFVDLDDFKAVNDTHGHQAGDVLLQEVAARLRAAVREGDVVARLGGDEFTVALRELQDEHHARAVAERIAAAFATPFDLGTATLAAHASVGVALFPAHGDDAEALLRAADRAMYHAKGAREGRVAFAEAVDEGGAPGL
jgi:diguanylate cyclase (GGDEF)-like protein